jgi:ribosome assembly protein YihI (activator of Der GTPase)
MANIRALERRVEAIERQVTGHHQHGTLASRLAKLEETVEGGPMERSSIAQRLDEIEAEARGESIPERVDAALGEDRSTGDSLDERLDRIEQRLSDLENGIENERDPERLEELLDRVEARLLALERARTEE